MSAPARLEIDGLDRQLVERLRIDGRENNRSLAAALGVNESTVATRLRRLESAGVMRVVAVTDMEAFGMGCLAFAFVTTVGRSPREVAEELAGLPAAIAVITCTGDADIVLTLLSRDLGELADALGLGVRAVPGVGAVRCELAAAVSRFDSRWAGLQPDRHHGGRPPRAPGQTDLDGQIVAALQLDARSSNRSIAADLGVSEATVRARLRRMEAAGAIRIQAICDVESFGLRAHGFLGVRCAPGAIAAVERELVAHPELGVVARTVGSYDLCAVVAADSRPRLLETVFERIASTPGVLGVDLHESATTIKHVYTWVRLAPSAPLTASTVVRTA